MKQSIVMKHIQTFVFAAICGFVLTLTGAACAESTYPGVATVDRLVGESRYSLGDGVWHPLVAGKILKAGAVIQTGHDATVDIILGKKILMPQATPLPDRVSLATDEKVRDYVSYRPFAEQNAIRMMGDTVLAIDKLMVSDTGVDTVSDTELDLRQGGIYNSVKKLSGASQYIIKIPNGIAGVRGTMFYVNANGKCIAYKNSVVLSIIGPDGKPMTVVVNEGYQFDPQNQGNGQPSPLPPGISALPPGISPVPRDLGYDLDQIFAALRTLYYGEVNFTFDKTELPISPTAGVPLGRDHSFWWSWF
jgi:FecR protein